MNARTIIIGDVHGCRDELDMLLERVAFGSGDRLVLVGDLVVRGPDPAGVIDLCVARKADVVRGNHEDKLLRFRSGGEMRFGEAQLATIAKLGDEHWAYMATLPLWLDLPDHGVRVVHAGVVPGVPIEKQDPRALLYMRSLDERGGPLERRGDTPWGVHYAEEPHVVFGHNAQTEPQIHPFATGLDTGCVYGGKLTAMVLAAGARPPPVADRKATLMSVDARKNYASR